MASWKVRVKELPKGYDKDTKPKDGLHFAVSAESHDEAEALARKRLLERDGLVIRGLSFLADDPDGYQIIAYVLV